MITVKFEFVESWDNSTAEYFEFEDDATESDIQEGYNDWLWNLIRDRCHWEIEEDEK